MSIGFCVVVIFPDMESIGEYLSNSLYICAFCPCTAINSRECSDFKTFQDRGEAGNLGTILYIASYAHLHNNLKVKRVNYFRWIHFQRGRLKHMVPKT